VCQNNVMSRSVLVIVNPISGRAQEDTPKDITGQLETHFAAYDYHADIRLTSAKGDAHAWAMGAKHHHFDSVAVVGGDGTIMEVISGMLSAHACLPLFVLPAGTGNLLARTLHIPEDPVTALLALLEGETRALDVGYIKNKRRYFIVAAGAGVDADTMRDANRDSKARFGRQAYVWAILRNLFQRRVVDVTLWLEETTSETTPEMTPETTPETTPEMMSVRLRAHSVLVFNASEINVGPLRVGPGVTPHDGMLEVAVLRGVNVWSFLVDAWHLLSHTLRHRNAPDRYSVRRVHIAAKPALLTQADGDVLGETPLDIEVLPHAIDVMVPRAYLDYLDPDKTSNPLTDNPIVDALV